MQYLRLKMWGKFALLTHNNKIKEAIIIDSELYLKGLHGRLDFLKTQVFEIEQEDLDIENYTISLFKMAETDNYIMFSNFDNTSVESTCNGIRPEAYDYLISVLNKYNNILVSWSQVEGTTSDYIIFYDINKTIADKNISIQSFNDAVSNIFSHIDECYFSYKYREVKDGTVSTLAHIF